MKFLAFFLIVFLVFLQKKYAYGQDHLSCNRACKLSDPKLVLNNCALKRAKAAVKQFVKGVDGYPKLGPLEVGEIKGSRVGGNDGIKLDIRNVTIFGLADLRMKKMKLNIRRLQLTAKGITNFTLDGFYEIDGHLLLLPITGKGRAHIELKNVKMTYDLEHNIVNKNGVDYVKVSNIDLFTHTIDYMHFDMENLFIGGNIIMDEDARRGFNSLLQLHMSSSISSSLFSRIRDRLLETVILQYQQVPYNKLLTP